MVQRVRFGALIALALLLAGCAPTATATAPAVITAGTIELNLLDVGGVSRSYIVRAPEAVTGPLPVLVVLHGAGGNAERAELATGFTADAAGYIVVYPNGTQAAASTTELSWNAGACCGVPAKQHVDDVSFIAAVLDDVAAQYAVDTSRVYATGFSNGGMLAYRLACERGDLFTAVAVVGGALNVSECTASNPMSVLAIHGRADATVPYDGGNTNERTAARFGLWANVSVAESVGFWRDRDGCVAEPRLTNEATVSIERYEGCEGDTFVELVSLAEGTHVWPSLANGDYDASGAILEFFRLGPAES